MFDITQTHAMRFSGPKVMPLFGSQEQVSMIPEVVF